MAYKFKKLADLDTTDELPESGHVVGLDENGKPTKIPITLLDKPEEGNESEDIIQCLENVGLLSLARKDDNTVFTDKDGNVLLLRDEAVQGTVKAAEYVIQSSTKKSLSETDVILGIDKDGNIKRIPGNSFGGIKSINGEKPDAKGNVTVFESFIDLGKELWNDSGDLIQIGIGDDTGYYRLPNGYIIKHGEYPIGENRRYLTKGAYYKVVFNDKEYILEAKEITERTDYGDYVQESRYICVGNTYLWNLHEHDDYYPVTTEGVSEVDTGEPFLVSINSSDYTNVTIKSEYFPYDINPGDSIYVPLDSPIITVQRVKKGPKMIPAEYIAANVIVIPLEKIGYESEHPDNYTYDDIIKLFEDGYNVLIGKRISTSASYNNLRLLYSFDSEMYYEDESHELFFTAIDRRCTGFSSSPCLSTLTIRKKPGWESEGDTTTYSIGERTLQFATE